MREHHWASVERSVGILSTWYMSRVPFFFVRIGDGAIECLSGRPGMTCDGEPYSETMAIALKRAIAKLKAAGDQVHWGDWRLATGGSVPRYVQEWEELIEIQDRRLLHYEAMLLMSCIEQQHNFFKIVKRDRRTKVIIGAEHNIDASHFLAAHYYPVPMDGRPRNGEIIKALEELKPEVILFGAGMAGLVEVVEYWNKERNTTCLHLGSALDPLFYKCTRSRQASKSQLLAFYEDLL